MVLLATLILGSRVSAYSVLTHEATIDAAWDSSIKPLLLARFPKTSATALDDARAYAYGGSVIHDLGYYPFGSKFFSNLLHYVRSGEFVESLIKNSADVNEYAFALGALGHYTSDNNGHPIATNHVVPIREVRLSAGAEFIVVICGDIMTMPGLPKVPSAEIIGLDEKGQIAGLF